MATARSPHELITSSRVVGARVYNKAGERIGHIDDLSVHKVSGQVQFAIMSFGGFLGIGENLHPVPWKVLSYDIGMDGYVVPLTKAELEKAPSLSPKQLEDLGAGDAAHNSIVQFYAGYAPIPPI